MAAYKALFSGEVQGVGFRFVAKKKADLLGLKGWVKNLQDGRVETFFQGDREKIERIIKELKESFSARFVEESIMEEKELSEFKISL